MVEYETSTPFRMTTRSLTLKETVRWLYIGLFVEGGELRAALARGCVFIFNKKPQPLAKFPFSSSMLCAPDHVLSTDTVQK